jgi:hypothetical protein
MALSYFSTWMTQNYSGTDGSLQTGTEGGRRARDLMNEQSLFAPNGWAELLPKGARPHLSLLLDDGWDVPYGSANPGTIERFGSLVVDRARFPSLAGPPADRLRALCDHVRTYGWAGLGLWVASQMEGDTSENIDERTEQCRRYYERRVEWSRQADVRIWKLDWGLRGDRPGFRPWLLDLARGEWSELVVENTRGAGPVNVMPGRTGGFASDETVRREYLEAYEYSDLFRTYDVTAQLAVPSTIARVTELLRTRSRARGIINCEDELYLAAAIGCSVGVMRSEVWPSGSAASTADARHGSTHRLDEENAAPNAGADPHRYGARLTEVLRALAWLDEAPPFRTADETLAVSDAWLEDSWLFRSGETWCPPIVGHLVEERAPAVVARNAPLPRVSCRNEPPYIAAACHPTGRYALAAMPRTHHDRGAYQPRAAVDAVVEPRAKDREAAAGSADSEAVVAPIALFGHFDRVRLELRGITAPHAHAPSPRNGLDADTSSNEHGLASAPGPRSNVRVMLSDLAAPRSRRMDISGHTRKGSGNQLVVQVPGAMIDDLCRSSDPRDVSHPGVRIEFTRRT